MARQPAARVANATCVAYGPDHKAPAVYGKRGCGQGCWPPTGDKSLAMAEDFTADSGDDKEEFHFLSGRMPCPLATTGWKPRWMTQGAEGQDVLVDECSVLGVAAHALDRRRKA